MTQCTICPRSCGVDRESSPGVCREGREIRVAKIMLHHFEEPCISGAEDGIGSGAIFFSGCSLKCVFCQNREISHGSVGEVLSPRRLASEILSLQSMGAYNINLVTPTHFTSGIIEALDLIKGELSIPVIWNTSGYERPETIKALSGCVDVFLTDFKYFSSEISSRYSSAPDYCGFASAALSEMVRITGKPEFEGEFLKRGTVVRHLVLPGCYRDSINVLKTVAACAGAENVLLSLMAQYTPEFLEDGYPEIDRRITTFEYDKVLTCAEELGFDGYMQSRESASARYTPDF